MEAKIFTTTDVAVSQLIELIGLREQHIQELKALNAKIQTQLGALGEGSFFIDDDNIVYEVVRPRGTFVEFRDIDYNRSRKEGEDRGSLPEKKAHEVLAMARQSLGRTGGNE